MPLQVLGPPDEAISHRIYLIGLRYIKRGGTPTEDHFLFEEGQSVVGYYKGSIEDKLPEYRGTHKQPVTFTLVDPIQTPITREVNTISVLEDES